MIIRFLPAFIAAAAFVSQATAQQATPTPPPYYLERIIAPPADFVAGKGTFTARAMNAQAYVAFNFVADHSQPQARRTPLVYQELKKPFIALVWPGGLNIKPGEAPHIRSISDVAEDGSFWVAGSALFNDEFVRGVSWKVQADGSSTLYGMENLYFNGTPSNEERTAYPNAVNSSGTAVGFGEDEPPLRSQIHTVGVRWNLPAPQAQRLTTDQIFMNPATDLDEAGNFIAPGFFHDRSYIGAFFNYEPLPTVSGRSISPNALEANRIVGSYQFEDAEGQFGPFVYTVGDSSLTRLPRPTGLNGETFKDGLGDAGNAINAQGDVVGEASNPPSLGDAWNPSYQVLWQRQPDGTYRVHSLESILQKNRAGGDAFRNAELVDIAADGSILLVNAGTARIMRPGVRPTDQPLNVSTRLRVQTGENVLIGGMIVTGAESKNVVLRAIGPSLTGDGVPGALEDPKLELYRNGTLHASNDDWTTARAFFEPGGVLHGRGFEPRDERESVIVTSLDPNQSFTAVVSGKDGNTGVALVEAYDFSPEYDSQLANISTRGFVDLDDDAMIGGFIIGGNGTRVLIRALGPSLETGGIASALQDPTLQLFDGNGDLVSMNDDWQDGQPSEIPEGFAPAKPAESAIVQQLGSGGYTAVVRGKNDTRGVGLVEVYNLD